MSGQWIIEPAEVTGADAQGLLESLSQCLQQITGDSGVSSFSPREMAEHGALFVVARNDKGVAVGCGALRPLKAGVAELKRMYAQPDSPGAGTKILQYLEAEARHLGYQHIWLETRRVNERAVGFYLARGYQQIENYGHYQGRAEAICFAKNLNHEGW
ncbi:MAG: GNAT family N-acetyltransferase [Ewingella sp.]|uniref:GNAT family N-acetyltransferase n=1 Tax=Ewingella allii TaxID=3092550 RepID=UPI00265410E9|nr:GNAT family N-acetyltransferase [Ewingella sp.]